MNTRRLPRTDSIQELARFWDTHDLTDFQEQVEEVPEPVFAGGHSIRVPLKPNESKAIRQIAETKGVSQVELVREWVVRGLQRRKSRSRTGG